MEKLNLRHLMALNFRPMTDSDYEGFGGVEGDGYISDYPDAKTFVIMDVQEETIMFNHMDAEGHVVAYELIAGPLFAEQIC